MTVMAIVTVVAVVTGHTAGGPPGRTQLERPTVGERGRHVADRNHEIADDGYEREPNR